MSAEFLSEKEVDALFVDKKATKEKETVVKEDEKKVEEIGWDDAQEEDEKKVEEIGWDDAQEEGEQEVEEIGWDDVAKEGTETVEAKETSEVEKIYEFTDLRREKMKYKRGDGIFLERAKHIFGGITKEGKLFLKDVGDEELGYPESFIITETEQEYDDYIEGSKEIKEGKQEEIEEKPQVEVAKEKPQIEDFKSEFNDVLKEYKGDSKEIMLTNLLKRIDQIGRDEDLELKEKVIDELDNIGKADKNSAESGLKIETKALKGRLAELWNERSKILMEKNSKGKTDKFQVVEEEIAKIKEELKGRGVKFELNKWVKEAEEEEIIDLVDEVKEIETTAEQRNRIQEELEKLQNKRDEISKIQGIEQNGPKLRELRKTDRQINELEDKLKYFQEENTINAEIQEISKEDKKLRKIAEEEKERILKMKPKEKKKLFEGIANLGYRTTEMKSKVLGGAMSWLSKKTKDNKFLHTFFNSYTGIYEKAGKRAKNARETVGKGKISRLSGAGQGMGNLFKYGRIIYDAIGSGSARGLNPFRHVTVAAMFIGRGAEAVKETRFEYGGAKENTRVKDEKRAMNEALKIYEEVYGQEGLEKFKKGEKASESLYNEKGEIDEKKAEEQKAKFEKAYKDNLPEDIKNRLNKMDFPVTKWYKIYFNKSKDVKVCADRLIKKINKIENNNSLSPEEKKAEKQEFLRRKEELINDLDRMVGDQGMVDNIAYWSRFTEKVSKGVATALIFDSVARLASAGWNMRHLLDRFSGEEEQVVEPKIFRGQVSRQQSIEDVAVKPLQKETAKYDLSGKKTDPFNTEFKKSVEAASKQAETESVAAAAVKQAESVKNIDIKIEGKIDTFSEAIYEAAKQADSKTQDNFIHKVLGNEEVIDDSNRGKFLSQTVRELSVANIETGDDLDVKNLVHEGNIVRLKNDGSWEVLKGQGAADAEAVSELQLRKNWADAEGAKHGFKPEEVNFADNEHLDDRSFKTEVNGVEVIVDNQGHFSGEVGGKEFSGDISGLEEGQTAKGAISETIDNAKEEVEKAVDTKKIAAKAVKTEVAPEKISNETRGKLIHDFFGGVGLAHDDVEKINEIVNLEDGIQHLEEPLLKFLAEHRELINEPKFFEFSEKTGIEYDKPHFLKIYNTMPDDIKKIDMRAEGFMEAFAGPKVQMSSGLKKLFGFTADPSWKIRVDGTKIIENAYGKKGFNILVTENNITVEKSRLLFGTKKLFSGDFSLNNIGKVKNKIFGITE